MENSHKITYSTHNLTVIHTVRLFLCENILMKNINERLIAIGYSPICAKTIVEDYQHIGKTKELLEYLQYKEMQKSIREHVMEVLG